MNATRKLISFALMLLGLALPLDARQQTQSTAVTGGHLEQMVAPIALHPDALVAQILMAATYPLEIVEAYRWVEHNPDLEGQALEEALKQHDWDPSIKAMCGFPTVLKQMNDNLGWTQDLGDAFLGQKAELMDTIQAMRRKAFEAGNLKATEQQQVTQDDETIIIQPTSPDVIYVPTYSPVVVYGPSWYYPTWYYPWWYVQPPFGFGFVSFGFGFTWGFGLWGHCDWHHHDVHVDLHHFNNFNARTNIHAETSNLPNASGSLAPWRHNPEHRGGVSYRNSQVAQQFGAAPGSSRVTRDQAGGFNRAAMAGSARADNFGPGARELSRTSDFGDRPSSATPDRNQREQVAPQIGAGPGAGRMMHGQIRGVDRASPQSDARANYFGPRVRAAPPTFGLGSRAWTGQTHRSNPRPFAAAPPSIRHMVIPGGSQSGFRSSGFSHSGSGRGAVIPGGSGSFGGGRSFGGGGSHGGGRGGR